MCSAFPDQPHPATRKSGYCERHHAEYDRAIAAYRSAVYNFNHGRTQKKPPSRATYIRRIKFSALPQRPTTGTSASATKAADGLEEAWRSIKEWTRAGRVSPNELHRIKQRIDAAIAVLDPNR